MRPFTEDDLRRLLANPQRGDGRVRRVISTARLGVGSPIIGEDLILDAIAAVVIGGTSLFGGIGRIGGTVLGVLLIATIRNGLVLMNVSAFYQRIAIGLVILAAAALDALGRSNRD